MDPEKDTAEEQLLRVIEDGGKGKESAGGDAKGKPSSLVERLKNVLSSIKGRLKGKSTGRHVKGEQWDIRWANNLLWILLAALTIYIISDFVLFSSNAKEKYVKKMPITANAESAISAAPDIMEGQLKSLNEYVGALTDRNPFTGKGRPIITETTYKEPSARDKLEEMIEGLVLVGINRGANPDAVIEDSGAKQTYFVSEGDKVRDLTVKSISADSIVFEYEGEEIQIG